MEEGEEHSFDSDEEEIPAGEPVTGYIYAIKSPSTNQFYIGSTLRSIRERFNQHQFKYTYYQEGKGNYMSSFQIVAFGDSYIELLKTVTCDSKAAVHKIEGQMIREGGELCVNQVIAGRSYAEWYVDNRERKLQACTAYYQKNAEHCREYQRKLRETPGRKEIVHRYNVEYRKKNSAKLEQIASVKTPCECGIIVRKDYLTKHQKTQRHMNLKNQNSQT